MVDCEMAALVGGLRLLAFAYRRRALKQSLQYTGLSPRGRNGTIVSTPHWAQTAGCISRSPPPKPRCAFLRAPRHSGQRLGSLVYPREAKNSCSPAVKNERRPTFYARETFV